MLSSRSRRGRPKTTHKDTQKALADETDTESAESDSRIMLAPETDAASSQSQERAAKKQRELQQHQRVAAALKAGKPISHAMREAGYSESRSRIGKAGLPKGVINQLAAEAGRFRNIGKQFTPEDRADIVRGLLVENIVLGKDRATKSAELLGKDIAVGIFKADSNQVAVQINVPAGLEEAFRALTGPKE